MKLLSPESVFNQCLPSHLVNRFVMRIRSLPNAKGYPFTQMQSHLHYFCLPLIMVLCLLSSCSSAQISDYEDCSDLQRKDTSSDIPLTKEEKIALKEDSYYKLVSESSRCEESGSNSGSSSGSGSGSKSNSGSGSNRSGMPSNTLASGETSTASTQVKGSDPQPVSPEQESSGSANPQVASGLADPSQSGKQSPPNGKPHEQMDQSADNLARLRAQIKARADQETNPEIKAKLMKEYESLK